MTAPDDRVLMRVGDGLYEQNRSLDINNDGVIEVAQRVIDRRDSFFERR